jgi:lon-related putative ATP-dependent protease
MARVKPLGLRQLRRRCVLSQLKFKTTDDLEDLDQILGQARAVEAIQFGIGIQREGYNLFALGPSGTGKRTTISHFLTDKARGGPVPPDYCYVNNFDLPHKPTALRLPPGQGTALKEDMESLVEELRTAIPAAFESEDYRTRRQEIEEELKEQQEKAFNAIQEQAKERDIALIRTPVGLAFAPLRDEEVVSPDEFQQLPEEKRGQTESSINKLQEQLQNTIRQVREWQRAAREKMRELDGEVGMFAVGHLIEELQEKHGDLEGVKAYLEAVRQDVIDNVDQFRSPEEAQEVLGIALPRSLAGASPFRRYQVNVLVDRSVSDGAPVVREDHPTYPNLVGRIEHVAQMGALVTDFNLIKPGALHRANGGYLILDVRELLVQPYAWDGLKRALRGKQLQIESLGQALSLVSTVSLEPEPIPLDVKVVLIGDRLLYYLLYELDPDFRELFKVEADFSEELEREPENNQLYARMLATIVRREGLRAFDRKAVARVIEHSSRLAGDSQKLSTHLLSVADLLRECDYWAQTAGNGAVTAEDVERAIDGQVRRADRLRDRVQEQIEQGTIMIDTDGARVGQVNGLSVLSLGGFSFGRPSRITARARLGKGQVVDIEREVELGGPIHSKGVLILSGFLAARYAPAHPLSLSASLVFEQSYGGIEGDSASLAELLALLSELAQVPVQQSLAVTGSVDQHGQVQPIGGVNEKVEGFFDTCQARGLTGDQGVVIPAANVRNLMLRQDVVDAAREGAFRVYAVDTADQAVELLAGLKAGERDETGAFPAGSFNQMVESRLIELAKRQREFSAGEGDGEEAGEGPGEEPAE